MVYKHRFITLANNLHAKYSQLLIFAAAISDPVKSSLSFYFSLPCLTNTFGITLQPVKVIPG
jgi:hypothetical protein